MKQTINKVLDFILDRILAFTDYFIVAKYVSLSEGALLAFAYLRSLWYVIFGYHSDFNSFLPGYAWTTIFVVLSVFHTATFFAINTRYRRWALIGHAHVYCVLGALAVFDRISTPEIPGYIVLTFLSLFLYIRLPNDK